MADPESSPFVFPIAPESETPLGALFVYQEHFGLTALPFGETTDPARLVPLAGREAARRRLRYGMEQGRGPALLFGPPGSGKTIVAGAIAREHLGRSVHLTYPAMPAAELLAFLADELDGLERPASLPAPGLHATLRRLRTKLAGPAGRGSPTLLIVDEAHLIDDPATFEALRLLQNFNHAGGGPPDLMLLLVGAPEILLRLPCSMADRLTARAALGPMTAEESSTYVLGRLDAAGGDPRRPLFSPDQLATLHRLADGLPRRLNRLADLALLIAFADGLPRPDSRCLEIAAAEAEAVGCAP